MAISLKSLLSKDKTISYHPSWDTPFTSDQIFENILNTVYSEAKKKPDNEFDDTEYPGVYPDPYEIDPSKSKKHKVWMRPNSTGGSYVPPKVNVYDAPRYDDTALKKSTMLFYDFYAITNLYYTFANTSLYKPMEDKLRAAYIDVTLATANKMLYHLRITLLQELRHMVAMCDGINSLKYEMTSLYNAQGHVTETELRKLIATHSKFTDGPSINTVKKLFKFMNNLSNVSGANDIIPDDKFGQNIPDPDPDPSGSDTSDNLDDFDYSDPPIDNSEFEDEVPSASSDIKKDIGGYVHHNDYWNPEPGKSGNKENDFLFHKKDKNKLTEYLSGRLDPKAFKKLNKIGHEVGLTWDDVYSAYHYFKWEAGYGGEKWAVGVKGFQKLLEAYKNRNVEEIGQAVDHIYDLVHNNGQLLNKGGMYVPSIALDHRAKATSVARFLPHVSPFVKTLITQFLRYVDEFKVPKKVIQSYQDDLNAESIITSESKPFTNEEITILKNNKFISNDNINYTTNKYNPHKQAFIMYVPYMNKLNEFMNRAFIVGSHTNGKYSFFDVIGQSQNQVISNIQIFDSFDQLIKYITTDGEIISAIDKVPKLSIPPNKPINPINVVGNSGLTPTDMKNDLNKYINKSYTQPNKIGTSMTGSSEYIYPGNLLNKYLVEAGFTQDPNTNIYTTKYNNTIIKIEKSYKSSANIDGKIYNFYNLFQLQSWIVNEYPKISHEPITPTSSNTLASNMKYPIGSHDPLTTYNNLMEYIKNTTGIDVQNLDVIENTVQSNHLIPVIRALTKYYNIELPLASGSFSKNNKQPADSLAAAKQVVQNWKLFKQYVKKYGLPYIGFDTEKVNWLQTIMGNPQ